MSAIDLIDTHHFEAYIACVASDDQHVTYENDPLDELYTTIYSDLYEHCCSKIGTQMYMSFLKRVQVCVGYNFPRFTVVTSLSVLQYPVTYLRTAQY